MPICQDAVELMGHQFQDPVPAPSPRRPTQKGYQHEKALDRMAA